MLRSYLLAAVVAPLLILLLLFVAFDGFFITHSALNKYQDSQTKIINNQYDVYLINLDRDKERLIKMKEILNREFHGFERIEAIDASKLTNEYINNNTRKKEFLNFHNRTLKNGTVGCYMSHLSAWKKFITDSNKEFAIIFEDDARIISKYEKHVDEIIKSAIAKKHTWDILSFEKLHNGAPVKVANIDHDLSINLYLTFVSDASFYMINRKAAIELINHALPMNLNLDHYFTRTWEFDNLKFAGVDPNIAYQDKEMTSTRITLDGYNSNRSIVHKVAKLIFIIKTHTISFCYNLIQYIKIRS